MKLLLISPELRDSHFRFTRKEARSFWFPRLSLTTIAARTPSDIKVRIVDECVEDIDFNADVDLVGITVMTFLAPRAYEIADRFRARGVKVILGGIHSSMMPEEAKRHADCVVIGEADELWHGVIEDFKGGKLKPFYRMVKFPDLVGLPHPRRDLLKRGTYMTTNCLQTSRGCPFSCDFCSVTIFCGNTFRLRPVKEVVDEVSSIKDRLIVFVDDNIAGNRRYAKELFQALIPLKKVWGSQGSLTLARDPELLELAAKSGCVAMFVGIETLSQENLASANKPFNKVKEYEESIRRFHEYGIMVNAGMIFGFDNDDESVFERTVEFLERNKVELALFNILTPLPGTGFYKRMEAEGRIIDRDWSHYDGRHVVFRPKLMSPETLQNGFYWAYHRFFSMSSIIKRVTATDKRYIFERFLYNLGYRRMVKRIPEGRLEPLAGVLKRLQDRIPAFELENLIPNALNSLKEKVEGVSGHIEQFLDVRVRKNERLQALLLDLHGTLDRLSADELKKRILQAAEKARMDIIINFENLRHTNVAALKVLFDQKIKEELSPSIKIWVMNLRDSFKIETMALAVALNEIPKEEVY